MKATLIQLSLLFLYTVSVKGQTNIILNNPSFENPYLEISGNPACCFGARGWYSCGDLNLNTPDAQPGNFGIDLKTTEGKYYLSLVFRDNRTSESISQKFYHDKLKSGKSYLFSINLATSRKLISLSRLTQKDTYYNTPGVLRIWGGNDFCQKAQLLAESPVINNEDWLKFFFELQPDEDFSALTIEAYYAPSAEATNGNILIDACSNLKEIPEGYTLQQILEAKALFHPIDNDNDKQADELITPLLLNFLFNRAIDDHDRFQRELWLSTPYGRSLFSAYNFENILLFLGIKNTLTDSGTKALEIIATDLFALGFTETSKELSNTIEIFKKQQERIKLTRKEKMLLKNCDATLSKQFYSEYEAAKTSDYIQQYFEEIKLQLQEAYVQKS